LSDLYIDRFIIYIVKQLSVVNNKTNVSIKKIVDLACLFIYNVKLQLYNSAGFMGPICFSLLLVVFIEELKQLEYS